jgi:hypothetical protein
MVTAPVSVERETGARDSVVGIAVVNGLDWSGSSNPGNDMRLSFLHTLPDRPWSLPSPFLVFMTCWRDVTFTFHCIENIVQLRIFLL